MLPWAIFTGSPWFIPAAFGLIPMLLPEFIYNEIYSNLKVYRFLAISGYIIGTFIFTHFVIDKSLIIDVLHLVAFMFFGYLLYKRHLAVPVK